MSVKEFKPLRINDGPKTTGLEPLKTPTSKYSPLGIIFILSSIALPIILPITYPENLILSNSLLFTLNISLLFIVGAYLIENNIQAYRSVQTYRVFGGSIIIGHAVGSTVIPLEQVKEVLLGTLIRKYKEVSTKSGIRRDEYFTDELGNSVKAYSDFLPYGRAPFVSYCGGICLLVKLKNGSIIALTPENPEVMAQLLNENIRSNN